MSHCLAQQQLYENFYDATAQEKQVCGHAEQLKVSQNQRTERKAKKMQITLSLHKMWLHLTTANHNESVL